MSYYCIMMCAIIRYVMLTVELDSIIFIVYLRFNIHIYVCMYMRCTPQSYKLLLYKLHRCSRRIMCTYLNKSVDAHTHTSDDKR